MIAGRRRRSRRSTRRNSQCPRSSGIGYDHGYDRAMTRAGQMAAERTRYGTGANKSCFHDLGGARVLITGPFGQGKMSLHGAQVTSWKPAGYDEVLFISTKFRWEEGHAIRGGIRICFPWFRGKLDDPHAPAFRLGVSLERYREFSGIRHPFRGCALGSKFFSKRFSR